MTKARALLLLVSLAGLYALLVYLMVLAAADLAYLCTSLYCCFFFVFHPALLAFFIERLRLFGKPFFPLIRSRLSFFGLYCLIFLATPILFFIQIYFPDQLLFKILAIVVLFGVIVYPFDLGIEKRRTSFPDAEF